MRKFVLCCGLVLGLASPSYAAVIIAFDNTTPYNTTALTGFQTSGDQMDGMRVTATIGGVGDLALWADTAPTCGGATGTGWSLGECGDTFASTWTLTSTPLISSLFIDAGAGDTVFDVLGGAEFSPGSALGRPFTVLGGGDPYDILVTYSGPVGIGGAAPAGDLYRFMRIAFTNRDFAGTLTFQQDTDNLNLPGDIRQVPEPAGLLLLGMGLAGVARRRFRG